MYASDLNQYQIPNAKLQSLQEIALEQNIATQSSSGSPGFVQIL
jgi:hypothetical protein